jgi:hypothetical protein
MCTVRRADDSFELHTHACYLVVATKKAARVYTLVTRCCSFARVYGTAPVVDSVAAVRVRKEYITLSTLSLRYEYITSQEYITLSTLSLRYEYITSQTSIVDAVAL